MGERGGGTLLKIGVKTLSLFMQEKYRELLVDVADIFTHLMFLILLSFIFIYYLNYWFVLFCCESVKPIQISRTTYTYTIIEG